MEGEDVEYWQELIALASRRFAGDVVRRYLDFYEFEGAATEFNIDRVSDVGPRLYCGQKPLLASYSLVPPFLRFELRQAPAVRGWSPLRRNSRRTRAPHDPSKLHPVDRPFGAQIPTGLINKKTVFT